jgi:HEAT repeat protein
MPWAKGQSGNPGGRRKGESDLQAIARQHTAAAIQALVDALDDEKLCVAAATALLDRGYGRPAQRIDAQVNVLDSLNADELSSLAASLAAIAGDPDDASAGGATTH